VDVARIGQVRIAPPELTRQPGTANGDSFSGVLKDALGALDGNQSDVDAKVRNMLLGDGEELHSTMLAVEKASLSFELMMQVRNKVVNAYQEIARLQF
jgi:flagellar hook-basal body complex protein FliE